jgi:hypothetical protein
VDFPELRKSAAAPLTIYYIIQDVVTMAILEFKRQNVVEEIASTLQDDSDEVVEAIVVGKKKSGEYFSYLTSVDNIPELIGYLEALKTDLVLEMISQADRSEP